jgi:integrase/recombinase XerD
VDGRRDQCHRCSDRASECLPRWPRPNQPQLAGEAWSIEWPLSLCDQPRLGCFFATAHNQAKVARTLRPYIYSRTELRTLFNSTTAACPKGHCKLEPHTLRAILLLLYGAGLRVSEALALTLDDVDVAGALLMVRDTKFHKTRMVPLGAELNQEMARYAVRQTEAGHNQSGTAPFFVLRRGGAVQRPLVEARFKDLREYANVKRVDGARYQPRLHDLRHSFAVHRPVSWYQQGADVQKLLPQLFTYLGHLRISDTQPYLTMIPELLHEASARFERYAWKEGRHD